MSAECNVIEHDQAARLCDVVKRHRVCWVVTPMRWPRDPARRRIGFELDIWGTDVPAESQEVAECSGCRQMLIDLLDLAEWIIPSGCREHRDDRDGCEFRIRFSPNGRTRHAVLVEVDVMCGNGVAASSCRCEGSCLSEMQRRLVHLGARAIGSKSPARRVTRPG